MTRIQAILLFTLVVVLFGIVCHMDAEEEGRQQQQYCEMVKLWKDTNGEKGWPAYNGEKGCK